MLLTSVEWGHYSLLVLKALELNQLVHLKCLEWQLALGQGGLLLLLFSKVTQPLGRLESGFLDSEAHVLVIEFCDLLTLAQCLVSQQGLSQHLEQCRVSECIWNLGGGGSSGTMDLLKGDNLPWDSRKK